MADAMFRSEYVVFQEKSEMKTRNVTTYFDIFLLRNRVYLEQQVKSRNS